jgi:hypothetical protein
VRGRLRLRLLLDPEGLAQYGLSRRAALLAPATSNIAPNPLDVEAHVEDVALGDDVVLALQALKAAAGGLGATSRLD